MLRMCDGISDIGIAALMEGCTNLRLIDIFECSKITYSGKKLIQDHLCEVVEH